MDGIRKCHKQWQITLYIKRIKNKRHKKGILQWMYSKGHVSSLDRVLYKVNETVPVKKCVIFLVLRSFKYQSIYITNQSPVLTTSTVVNVYLLNQTLKDNRGEPFQSLTTVFLNSLFMVVNRMLDLSSYFVRKFSITQWLPPLPSFSLYKHPFVLVTTDARFFTKSSHSE